MRLHRFSAFRWLASFALAVFYLHALPDYPVRLNPALGWVSPTFNFLATAYCVDGTTASGEKVAPGMVAADPRVLPFGSLIEIETDSRRGIYRVTDTGALVKGKRLDVYITEWAQAVAYGVKRVKVTVLQYGAAGERK